MSSQDTIEDPDFNKTSLRAIDPEKPDHETNVGFSYFYDPHRNTDAALTQAEIQTVHPGHEHEQHTHHFAIRNDVVLLDNKIAIYSEAAKAAMELLLIPNKVNELESKTEERGEGTGYGRDKTIKDSSEAEEKELNTGNVVEITARKRRRGV